MSVVGYVHRIQWGSPYTEPPDGGLRVLAEVFCLNNQPPGGFPQHTPGGGYCYSVACVSAPSDKRLTQEQLASVRKKRLVRRIERRFPLFAEEIIAEKIANNQSYYEGVTDPEIAERRNAAIAAEDAFYRRCVASIGVVFIYGEEPETIQEE